jgi:hypothetical protein
MTSASARAVRRGSLLTSAALAAAALALFAGGASAHTSPDPGVTLTPPPPDGYSCQTTGSGTICQRRMDFTHVAGYDGTCPQGFDLLENGHTVEIGHRYYDRDGFLVRRDLHESYSAQDPMNVIYNSVTGTSVPYSTYYTEFDTFAVPGDFDTMTARNNGNFYTVTLPGAGLLAHDVGEFTFSPDGDVLVDHGPKMLFDGDVAKLCTALE